MLRLSWIFVWLVFLGCEKTIICEKPEPRVEPDAAVCEEAAQYEASARVGTGEEAYEEFPLDDVLRPVFGPQGGHHIYAGVRATGLNPGIRVRGEPLGCPVSVYDAVRGTYTHSFADNLYPAVVTEVWRRMEGTPESADWFIDYVYIDLFALQSAYEGQDEVAGEAHVTLTDKCGTTVEDTRPFRLSLTDIETMEP